MQRHNITVLLLALAFLGQVEARISNSKATLANDPHAINPPLKDVASDKKFFGPPFPADYPDDKRPAVDKAMLDKLRSPKQAYPALQSKEDYDADYVKDENSDKGAWQAQFEYDNLRRKLNGENDAEKRAQDEADRRGRDADGAQSDADAAAKKVRDAQKDVDDATHGEDDAKKASDFDGPPSHEKLEELKKAVKDAEEKYEQQKKAFAQCEAELEAAKKEVEDLKSQHAAMEEKLSAETKLFAAKKEAKEAQVAQIKFNLQKTKEHQEAEAKKAEAAVSAKVKAAQDKVTASEKVKADMEKALTKEKDEHEKAKKSLQKEQGDVVNVKKQLTDATAKLQKIHGYKPVEAAPSPTNTGASGSWFTKMFR